MIENTFGKEIIPANDTERLQVLRRYRIMDTPSEASFDNIAKLATQIFNVPISLVSLVDAERVFFKANIGMGKAKESNRGKSLCALAVLDPGVTVFEDALKEPCLMVNPNVAGDFGLRFYAGAPLITYDGFLIGTLCIIDKQPRVFTKNEENILQGLAVAVMDQIELRRSALEELDKKQQAHDDLAEQREETYAINEELSATNEELRESYRQSAQTENRFRLISDNISQLAWMTDETGYIFWYNQRWYEYTGTTLEEMQGWGWEKVQHPDHIARVVEKWTAYIKSGEIFEMTFPLRGKDGAFRWFLTRAVPAKNENDEITSWFGTNTDITEQYLMEQRKDDFLSIASHELKTPITSLKTSLQLLDRVKDKHASPLQTKLIDQANRSMDKMTALVDELLNINRLTEGQLQLNKTTFTVAEMLNGCCNHIRVAGKHDLVIQGDEDLQIEADEHRIDQVIVNLVNNAAKYAPDSKEIYLGVEKQSTYLKVSVRDTGPGIPPEKLPFLFDRYYRADHSGVSYTGLGLGLYICAEIIKRHGGQMGVESELGKGSIFWFTLPL
jgi:PAS domain S-box-containing protein